MSDMRKLTEDGLGVNQEEKHTPDAVRLGSANTLPAANHNDPLRLSDREREIIEIHRRLAEARNKQR